MYYSEDWQWSRLYQDYYIREEDWDSSWPGADDLWEWDENDDYYYLWWSNYDWDWYFAPLDLVPPANAVSVYNGHFIRLYLRIVSS